MTSPAVPADVYTDFKGLAELRGRAQGKNDKETLREVAGKFESLFIQMMLKSMRDASLGEGLLDSEQTKTYQSMFDQQMAIDLSKGRGLGLAEMMVRQLTQSGQFDAEEAEVPVPEAPRFRDLVRPATRPAAAVGKPVEWMPGTPREFVQEVWPHAKRAADSLGTDPEVLIAQAALETGWGKHMIRGTDGRNSFNLFGIKADARWQGDKVVTETVEFRDGLMRRERASFRAYGSVAESFADYAGFLKSNPRYAEALGRTSDSPGFTRALAEAGYATDPDYSSKINRIMDSGRIQEALSDVKEAAAEPLTGTRG